MTQTRAPAPRFTSGDADFARIFGSHARERTRQGARFVVELPLA